MTIINRIYIGEELYNLDDLSDEQRKEVAEKLNRAALESIGYRESKAAQKTTA